MLDDFFFFYVWIHPSDLTQIKIWNISSAPPPKKKLLRSEQKTRKQVKEFQKLGMERLVWGEGVS